MVDEGLWERGRCGDAPSIEELMRLAAEEAHELLRRKGVPEAERDDLVAEIQLDTLRSLRDARKEPRNVRAFLYFRARAALTRHWRLRGRVARAEGGAWLDETPTGARDQAEGLHERAMIASYERCVRELPEPQQRIYRMLVEERLCQRQIADRLAKSEGWVHRRLSEARERVSLCLRREGFLPGI